MPNKTISVPDDVLPIIERLDMPFSRWVTAQLRRHAAESATPFTEQLAADAALRADNGPGDRGRPSREDAKKVGKQMSRSAPW